MVHSGLFAMTIAEEIGDETDKMEHPITSTATYKDVDVDGSLTPHQHDDIVSLFSQYANVLTDKSGCTSLTDSFA